MRLGLSTHLFLHQRLSVSLLENLHKAGVEAIEILAARDHFDYTSRSAVREIGSWFRDHADIRASLHQPVSTDAEWSRHSTSSLDLVDPDKSRRILAMDETKRAIEVAEFLPLRSIALRLGQRGGNLHLYGDTPHTSPHDSRDPLDHPPQVSSRFLEHALTAIEHLKAFAAPLGVQLLLETLENELTTPDRLLEILHVGHFSTVGVTLDVGHAHLMDHRLPGAGIDTCFSLLGPRLVEIHLADNDGNHDLHLWPHDAPLDPVTGRSTGIDWPNVARHLHQLLSARPAADAPTLLFEIAPTPADTGQPSSSTTAAALARFGQARSTLLRELDTAAQSPSGTR